MDGASTRRVARAAALAALVALAWVHGAHADDYRVEGSCRDGRPQGPWRLIGPEGTPRALGAFSKGRRTGSFIFWNDAGVRIAHYRKGLLHSKAFCVDRKMCVITSVNIDMRSFFVNFELSMFVYDEAFSREVRLMQERYLMDSVPVAMESWCARRVHRRFVENVCQILGPLL